MTGSRDTVLTRDQLQRLTLLSERLRDRVATVEDVKEFARLAHDAGLRGDISVPARIKAGGFRDMEDFARRLEERKADAVIHDILYGAKLASYRHAYLGRADA